MLLVFLDIWHVCEGSCHDQMRPSTEKASWKLCIKRNRNDYIQLKIFKYLVTRDSWLAIGFPEVDGKIIDFFVVTNSTKSEGNHNSKKLKQSHEHVNCKDVRQKSPSLVIVNCKILNKASTIIHLTSDTISIFYLSGMGKHAISTKGLGKILVSNGTQLSFNLYETKVKQDAGSTAMKLLRNYGKSMAAIISIAFFLTIVIAVTICCCCKKTKAAVGTFKEKEVAVSFYRDNGEVEDENDSSDEKVAFIRNNNGKNSSV